MTSLSGLGVGTGVPAARPDGGPSAGVAVPPERRPERRSSTRVHDRAKSAVPIRARATPMVWERLIMLLRSRPRGDSAASPGSTPGCGAAGDQNDSDREAGGEAASGCQAHRHEKKSRAGTRLRAAPIRSRGGNRGRSGGRSRERGRGRGGGGGGGGAG